MTLCAELAPLVSAHAAGGLDDGDARRVELHVASCERCRSVLADTRVALDFASLPAVSDAERRALVTLPSATLTELRRDRVGTPIWRAFVAGFAAAAAIAMFIAAPVQVPLQFTSLGGPSTGDASTAWEEPDPDELLAVVGVGEDVSEETVVLARAELIADAAYGRALDAEQ